MRTTQQQLPLRPDLTRIFIALIILRMASGCNNERSRGKHRDGDPSGRRFERPDIECLMQHLRRQLGDESIHASRGEDPPDFWLTVADTRYAVEVTSVADVVKDVDGDVRRYYPECQKLAQRIEKEAGDNLAGFYALQIYGNPIIPNGRQARGLIEQAICYIRRTRDDEEAQGERLFADRADTIEIQKVGPCLRVLYPEMPGGVRLWPSPGFCFCSASDGLPELCRAIRDKLKLARKLPPHRTILLIHSCCNRNFWPEFKQAASYLKKEIGLFHSVFLIQETLSPDMDQREIVPHCLHTQSPFWKTPE